MQKNDRVQAPDTRPIVRHAPGMLNARRRWGGLEGASGCGFQADAEVEHANARQQPTLDIGISGA